VPGAGEIGSLVCFAFCAFLFSRGLVWGRPPRCKKISAYPNCTSAAKQLEDNPSPQSSPFVKGRGGLDAQRLTGFPVIICRRLPKPSFPDAWFPDLFRAKIRADPWLKTSCVPTFLIHPCKSVFIRGSLSKSYSSGVLRHAIRLSPVWGEDEAEGTFFLA
jgi:hypothetical protein